MTSGAVPGARVLAVVRRWPPVRGEAGAVTIEFVVIFPLILLILAFIAFVSFAIAAQSEVQQVAFERTRFGMLLAQDPGESGVHAEGVGAGEPDLGQQRRDRREGDPGRRVATADEVHGAHLLRQQLDDTLRESGPTGALGAQHHGGPTRPDRLEHGSP